MPRHGRTYAKGQNLKWALCQAYDDALAKYDLLAMPTIPFVATKAPDAGCPREEYVTRALDMIGNTRPFDASGYLSADAIHPACCAGLQQPLLRSRL